MKAPDPRIKIVPVDEVLTLRAEWRRQGRTIVWTNGCFDVLHIGHIRFLSAAARLGDVLVVGVNSDASVRRLKGPGRPVIEQTERSELLASLACVDLVVIFEEDTPVSVLERLQPEIHCKGAEYAPPHGKPVYEADTVHAYGGKIYFLPQTPNRSTSGIIQRISEEAMGH